MTDERIAAIRERCEIEKVIEATGRKANGVYLDTVPFMLAEIDRLTAELAAYKAVNPPKVHGEWEKGKCGPYFICDKCLQVADFDFDYCPNCGAAMKEDKPC